MASNRKVPRAGLWSNLSPETLYNIGKRLERKIDVFRCRSVCRNWRASINPKPNPSYLSPFLPRKISNSTLPFINRSNETLILFARIVFLVQPISYSSDRSSWIFTVEEVVPGKLRILNPLSKDPVKNLPSNFPKYLNLLDFRVTEIAKSYGFKYASDWNDVNDVHVVLCSDSTAMVLYGEGTLIGVRLRNGNWGFVRDSLITRFSDVISFKGSVCAVDFKGNLHSVDHKTMKVNKTVTVKLPGPDSWNRKRLVANEGKLWLVTWSCNGDDDKNSMLEKNQFKVYRVGELHKESVMETSLRGWSLFVSLHWCFIVRAQDLYIREYLFRGEPAVNVFSYKPKYSYFLNELKWYEMNGDYLVFSQNCFESSAAPLLHSLQLFKEASVNLPFGVFYFRMEDRDRIESVCGTIAGALWPPPTWFLPDLYSSSEDHEDNEESDSWVLDVSTDDIKKELLTSLIVAPFTDTGNSNEQDQMLRV